MRKKEEVIAYPSLALFYDFCDEYENSILFLQHLKKAISKFLFIDLSYLLITILLIYFKLNQTVLSLFLFLIFTIASIICIVPTFTKRKLKQYVLDLYPSFLKQLNKQEYSSLNSFTTLGEMAYYIRNIKNQPDDSLKGNHPTIWSIILFFISVAITSILSLVSDLLNPYIYLILLAILIILFCCILIFKDLLNMAFSKDYDQLADSVLLSCIEERRLEILNSSQKNLFEKAKYALRLGEYH